MRVHPRGVRRPRELREPTRRRDRQPHAAADLNEEWVQFRHAERRIRVPFSKPRQCQTTFGLIQVVAHPLQDFGAAAKQHADRSCNPRSPTRTRAPVYQDPARKASIHSSNAGIAPAGEPLSGLQCDQGVEPQMRPAVNRLCLFPVVVFRRYQDIERVGRLSCEFEFLNPLRGRLQEGWIGRLPHEVPCGIGAMRREGDQQISPDPRIVRRCLPPSLK